MREKVINLGKIGLYKHRKAQKAQKCFFEHGIGTAWTDISIGFHLALFRLSSVFLASPVISILDKFTDNR